MTLTLNKAAEILQKHVTEEHLFQHALAVSAAMGAMAAHFNADAEHWRAVGYLHDVDYEKFPEEHCLHVEELLEPEGVDGADIRAIQSHGYGLCTDVEPISDMEKSLFTVDELTGIILAASLMRPAGITSLNVKSLMKKFKDKRFAAKCSRTVILQCCEMLNMDIAEVAELCIQGMQTEAEALGLGGNEE